jgi:pimeloyl-ACP methyl ester carboxylesterase
VPVALYLHGFASSPRGRKIQLLTAALGQEGWKIVAPDLNVPSFAHLDFAIMAGRAERTALANSPDVTIGSSLGAVVALEVARRRGGGPLVLIAPALGFGPRWLEKVPGGDPIVFTHHGVGRDLPIHRKFFEQMAALGIDREPPPGPVRIVVGASDESVPVDGVRRVWQNWQNSRRLAPGSDFVEIPGGDHGLVDHVGVIADQVRALL